MFKFLKINSNYLTSIFEKKNITIKYTIAGIASYLLYLCLLTFCIEIINSEKLLAAIITYGTAMIFNFFLLKIWVYKTNSDIKIKFIKYNLIALLGYFINNFGFWIFTNQLEIHYLKAQFILFFIISILNYTLNTLWTFKCDNNKYH